MNENYWARYKVAVREEMASYGDHTKTVLLFDLTTDVGTILEATNKEICTGQSSSVDRAAALGDVLWCIAALELHFNLPDSIYSRYIGSPMSLNPNHGLSLLSLHSDTTGYLSKLSEAMHKTSLDDVQFNLNKLLYSIYNIFIYYNMSPLTVLKVSMEEMTKVEEVEKPDHNKDYENDVERLAKLDGEVITMSVKIDKRCNNIN